MSELPSADNFVKGVHFSETRHIEPGIQRGGYDLVAVDSPDDVTPPFLTWFNVKTHDVIRERLGPLLPFQAVIIDLDGTIVQSEGRDGFFRVCWRTLMREADIEGTDEALDAWQKHVYRWEGNLLVSTNNMVTRIRAGLNFRGEPLDIKEQASLMKLVDPPILVKWRENIGLTGGSSLSENASFIIAERKEQIGKEILEEDPIRVLTLAPLSPGVREFVNALPSHIPLALASASRKITTILPILQAHAAVGNGFLLDRFDGLIFGEGDYGSACKPNRAFYEAAAYNVWRALHARRALPTGGLELANIVYIGDVIAVSNNIDAPGTRMGMHHIVFQSDSEPYDIGPLAVIVSDFPTLMVTARDPKNTHPTLKRLGTTLQ